MTFFFQNSFFTPIFHKRDFKFPYNYRQKKQNIFMELEKTSH